ncbi:DUF2303 family protein [Sinorhizobium sp. BG8]|uniref:DUF2303 family protein n=1 Tax=Sinorhizobium sp. BG8 TaxID=2613773 RepID=UPI00193D1FEF|nr:DUF2303 family protein [Sinorhizobium sp. BG8]QRM55120.1 DUF2303 family protein [Sinorhizobium sp. BG8]
MDQLSETAVTAIAALAQEAKTEIVIISLPSSVQGVPASIPVLLNRTNGSVSGIHNLVEPWRTRPERKIGTAAVATLESFVELVNRHRLSTSAIFAETDWQKPSLTAVIDYHAAAVPDNGKHRILYSFPQSEEWKVWTAVHGKAMDQASFAEFIEDHAHDLAAPDTLEEETFAKMFSAKVAFPNDLVVLSRGLQINAEVRVKNAIKLQSGESQIVFEEDHKNADGQPISVHGVFVINIPIFHGGEATRIPVRLRYKLRDGVIAWTFVLFRPDLYITEEVRRALEFAARETELPKFEGRPEMSGTSA